MKRETMGILLFLLMVFVFLGVSIGGAYLISITIVRRLLKPKGQAMRKFAYAGTFVCGFLLIATVIGWLVLSNVPFGR